MKILLTKSIKDEKFIEAGEIVDFEESKAKGLIAVGVAKAVEEPKKEIKLEKPIKKIEKEEE